MPNMQKGESNMKRLMFGITVEPPNVADTGAYVGDKMVRRWIGHCLDTISGTGRPWSSVQSGNAVVYVLKRSAEHAKPHPYHVIVFRGREAYCANLTQEQADEAIN